MYENRKQRETITTRRHDELDGFKNALEETVDDLKMGQTKQDANVKRKQEEIKNSTIGGF